MALIAAWISALPVLASEVISHLPSCGNLTVVISGAANESGNICMALYADDDQWKERRPAYRTAVVPLQSKTGIYRFETIPFAPYALKAFHDANSNMQLDKDAIGIPIEAYGFSGTGRGRFGPPSFKDARFTFDSSQTVIITLR